MNHSALAEESSLSTVHADHSGRLVQTALQYLQAVDRRRFDEVATMLDPNVEFSTPDGPQVHGAIEYVAALRRIAPIVRLNDVKRTFVDQDEVCVIYDLVTDTAAGAIPSVEWMSFRNDKIVKIRLIFHSKSWSTALQELAARTAEKPGR